MADAGDFCEGDSDNLCASDNSKLATAHSRMAMFPPCFRKASDTARMFVFLMHPC